MPVAHVNDITLGYHETGVRGRRAIILAPTILWGVETFEPLASELAADFHVIALDIHGHGDSGHRRPLTLESMADDYVKLLDSLNLSDVVWIGHSIGGMVGMRLALARPEMISSLVLIATAARPDPPPLREQTWGLWQAFGDGRRASIADAALKFLFAPATYENQPQLVERFRNKLIAFRGVEGILEAARAVARLPGAALDARTRD